MHPFKIIVQARSFLWKVGEHAIAGKEMLKFGLIFDFTMCGEPWLYINTSYFNALMIIIHPEPILRQILDWQHTVYVQFEWGFVTDLVFQWEQMVHHYLFIFSSPGSRDLVNYCYCICPCWQWQSTSHINNFNFHSQVRANFVILLHCWPHQNLWFYCWFNIQYGC